MFKQFLLIVISSITISSLAQFGDPVFDLIEEGITFSDQEKYDEAIVKFDEALKIDKKNGMALFEKGSAIYKKGDFKSSIKLANKVIKMEDPGYMMDAFILKADAHERLGDKATAIDVYEEATALYNQSSYLYRKLGLRYMKIGENEKAMNTLLESIQIDHLNADSHKAFANVLLKEGFYIRGYLASVRALMLDPKTKNALEIFNLIKADLQAKFAGDEDTLIVFRKIDPIKDNSSLDLGPLILQFNQLISALDKRANRTNFYTDYYLDFYKSIVLQGYTEAMFYDMLSNIKMSEYAVWLENPRSQSELSQYNNWLERYNWPDLSR